jgi:hypothetical protein
LLVKSVTRGNLQASALRERTDFDLKGVRLCMKYDTPRLLGQGGIMASRAKAVGLQQSDSEQSEGSGFLSFRFCLYERRRFQWQI